MVGSALRVTYLIFEQSLRCKYFNGEWVGVDVMTVGGFSNKSGATCKEHCDIGVLFVVCIDQ